MVQGVEEGAEEDDVERGDDGGAVRGIGGVG